MNGQWKFKGFADCNGEESGAHKIDYDDSGWLPGEVPGTVQSDLLANKVISDPFKDLNETKVKWVPQQEWWYRKKIGLSPEILKHQMVELVFDGLDTFAAVWVNGVKIGIANNMFIPWRFNITKAIKSGINVIAIQFKPIYKVAAELESKYGGKYGCLHADNCSARPYVRKAQYSFGWDWGPTLPTSGIWKKARILSYDEVILDSLTTLPTEVSEEIAKLKVTAEVYAGKTVNAKARFVFQGFGQRIEIWVNKTVASGQNNIEGQFKILKPKLWWPRGYGEQNLYDVTAEIYSDSGLLDKASVKCGVRSVQLLQEADAEGTCFTFLVNGKKVFCKGANWVPADSFLPRVTSDRYERLIGLAAEANMNMLRVWGGGVYEDDVFYDLCDKLGLMVWQDFMYACASYPEEDWFLKQAQREAEEVMRRLRGYACIVVWCGNNESYWHHYALWRDREQLLGLQIFNEILPKVCDQLDGTRPYRPSSPYGGDDPNSECEGTRHNWLVWSKQADYLSYLEDRGRFLTEFGWQAPPTLEVLKAYLDSDDRTIHSEAFEAHQKQVNGSQILHQLLALHYPIPENLDRFTLIAQLNQGEALKTAVTHWRSRMFKTSGCLIWQLDDCWPAVSWSLIDYGLNPKAAYFFVKRAFQPVIAPLIVKNGNVYVYVVNETERPLKSTMRFQVIDFKGEVLYSKQIETTAPSYTSNLVLEESSGNLPLKQNCVLAVALESNGVLLYEDAKTVEEPKNLLLPVPAVKTDVKKTAPAKFQIMLKTDVFAKALRLGFSGVECAFDDNFFDLLPGRQKIVKCALEKDLGLLDFKKALSVQVYPYLEKNALSFN